MTILGHRRKAKDRKVNQNSIDVMINKRRREDGGFGEMQSLHTYKNSMVSSKTGKTGNQTSEQAPDLLENKSLSGRVDVNSLHSPFDAGNMNSFDFAMRRRAVKRLRLKSDNTDTNINLYTGEKPGSEIVRREENSETEIKPKGSREQNQTQTQKEREIETKNIRVLGYVGSMDKGGEYFGDKGRAVNKPMHGMNQSDSNLKLLLKSRDMSLDMSDFDVNQIAMLGRSEAGKGGHKGSFEFMKQKTLAGGMIGKSGHSEVKMKGEVKGHQHSKSNYQSVRPQDFNRNQFKRQHTLINDGLDPNSNQINNVAFGHTVTTKDIKSSYIKNINNINLQNWRPENKAKDCKFEGYGITAVTTPGGGTTPNNVRRRSMIGLRPRLRNEDEHKRSGQEKWKRRELRRSRTRLGLEEKRRKSVQLDKLRGDRGFSQGPEEEIYGDEEDSEERKKKRKKKRVTRFDQRIYDKRELLESYRLHMRKHDDGKKDRRDRSEPGKVRGKRKVSDIGKSKASDKGKGKTKDLKIRMAGGRGEISEIGKKKKNKKGGKRCKSEIAKKRSGARGNSSNMNKM